MDVGDGGRAGRGRRAGQPGSRADACCDADGNDLLDVDVDVGVESGTRDHVGGFGFDDDIDCDVHIDNGADGSDVDDHDSDVDDDHGGAERRVRAARW